MASGAVAGPWHLHPTHDLQPAGVSNRLLPASQSPAAWASKQAIRLAMTTPSSPVTFQLPPTSASSSWRPSCAKRRPASPPSSASTASGCSLCTSSYCVLAVARSRSAPWWVKKPGSGNTAGEATAQSRLPCVTLGMPRFATRCPPTVHRSPESAALPPTCCRRLAAVSSSRACLAAACACCSASCASATRCSAASSSRWHSPTCGLGRKQ